ncbi:MAG: beta-ketoacyl-ACP synthase [Crocinitomicaceae bacterium]|nr:beta-ketoacyl-ACP synthase [Crocinitomicaceae bacterium]
MSDIHRQGRRVVVTGMGVVAPNAVGLSNFEKALRESKSGIRFIQELKNLNFACQVGGIPPLTEGIIEKYLSSLQMKQIKATGLLYGLIAGKEAWEHAGLSFKSDETRWESGCVFGSGLAGISRIREGIYQVDEGKVKRLGSTMVEQTMPSGISALLAGELSLGNLVSTNASACSTGNEAILMAYERIESGQADRMLAGSCDDHGPYVWGGFDSLRVLNRKMNDRPEEASRPMSESAAGFVPGSGAGALVLEELETARARGATIYAEVMGGALNAGGHINGGSMTLPNDEGVIRCIQSAMVNAGVVAKDVDLINGHLTATRNDAREITNWSKALDRKGDDFPLVQSTKSLIGHCLSAAGSIESVAVVSQLYNGFTHASANCNDLNLKISQIVNNKCITVTNLNNKINIVMKSGFGFGDVNSVVVWKKFLD